jgi:DNA polymerase III epsilon subunit-like protein
LEQYIFEECLSHYKNNFSLGESWKSLARRMNYQSGEALRCSFKRERQRQNIPGKGQLGDGEVKDVKDINQQKVIGKSPKILVFDIETSPMLAFIFNRFGQDIPYDHIAQDWHLICWSAKWLFDSEVMSNVLTPNEARNHDDKRIVKSMWNLIDEADVILAHNGKKFDAKKLSARFIKHGLNPPSPYQIIDTLLIARSGFGFTSNKLDDLCDYFELPIKSDTNFDLWRRCFYGDKQALEDMSRYCNNDSVILEELYLKLRPWIKNGVNWNLWNEDNVSVCPNCGGDIKFHGDYYTSMGRFDAWRCLDCGAVGRSKYNNLSKEKNKTIVR